MQIENSVKTNVSLKTQLMIGVLTLHHFNLGLYASIDISVIFNVWILKEESKFSVYDHTV